MRNEVNQAGTGPAARRAARFAAGERRGGKAVTATAAGAGQPLTAVASNLRRLRAERGISTVALSRDSGVARATLAQLESGRGNPTLETLYALANTLGVGLADVIAAPAVEEVLVVRADERARVAGAAVRARLVARVSSRGSLELYDLALRAGGRQRSEPHPPGVVEHLLVHGGRLRVGPETAPVELGPGDYARYAASVPHVYEAIESAATATLVMDVRA
jgi:transcriptional regulator with XRE-family HTH domain